MYVEELAAKHLRNFLNHIEKHSLRVYIYNLSLPTKTKKRLANLLFGVITHLKLVDWFIERLGLNNISKERTLNLLRILIYRLFIENNLEPLQRIKNVESINLEELLTKKERLYRELDRLPLLKRLSIRYSFPEFFVRKLSKFFNKKTLEILLQSLNSRLPYIWGCVNTTLYDREEVLQMLQDEGYNVEPDPEFDDLILIRELPRRIEKSRAFRLNMFIISEKASVATTHALEPKSGDIILDMAAAPGIKLICTAFKMGEGKFYAIDISPSRMRRLQKLVSKYLSGLPIKVVSIVGDARKVNLNEYTDTNKILLDAECTSTGLIPKSPDIKLRLTKNRLESLSTLQKQLLDRALRFSEENSNTSTIVYSVCSLFPEEGEYVVMDALRKHSLFEVDNPPFGSQAYLPDLGIRFFPHIHKTIGFFIARIRKIEK